MSITYFDSTRTFLLSSDNASYAFSVKEGFLEHIHFGGKISVSAENEDFDWSLFRAQHASFSALNPDTGFSLDVAKAEYPCFGSGDFRVTACKIRGKDGNAVTDLRYVSHKIYDGKPGLPGLPATFATETEAQTLEVETLDSVTGAKVILSYTVFPAYDAFCRHALVENTSDASFSLDRIASTAIDFPNKDRDLVHLFGTWAKERTIERAPVMHGTQSIVSRRGSSSHQHNPFVALADRDATEETGEVFGMSLVYSTNFAIDVETDTFGTTRVVAGIDPGTFHWNLQPGETFCTPEAVTVYSPEGLGGMSRRFHKLYRYHLCRGPWAVKERPILINNWEATYFNFNADKLLAIAETAKELGIEMLVMDDGWFGRRNNDNSSLGDWFVNEEKLGCTLAELVDRVNNLGMKFGIWFEPEMISPVSKLYDAHPDWALAVPNRKGSLGRNQLVLDMSRQDVQDYLFERMSDILSHANIAYVKWDFNRNLTEAGSALLEARRQGEIFHRYVLGLYALLERLLKAFPDLLLEGCSGGGGRFDAGMLYYSPQFWTSDDTDAMERLSIQFGTSMVYPASTMTAHVSAVPNHQTGRTVSMETRGMVAMAGAFGYELDLTQLSEEEKEIVKQQVRTYHEDFDTIQNGDYYRLIMPTEAKEAAWEYVSTSKDKAIVTYISGLSNSIARQKMIRLRGLCKDACYKDEVTGRIYTGDTLMNLGLNFSGNYADFSGVTVHLNRI